MGSPLHLLEAVSTATIMRVRPRLVLKVTVTRRHLQENDAIIISKLMQNNKS